MQDMLREMRLGLQRLWQWYRGLRLRWRVGIPAGIAALMIIIVAAGGGSSDKSDEKTEAATVTQTPIRTASPKPSPSPTLTLATTAITVSPQPTPSSTPAPTATQPPRTATSAPPAPPTAPPAQPAVAIVSVTSPVGQNQNATVVAQTSPGASCSITYVVPSGNVSEASGLGPATANASGSVQWTWKIGGSTAPGTGTITVRCAGASAQTSIIIQ